MFQRSLKLPVTKPNSIWLLGPLGTGKTAWLKAHLPTALYLDLLDYNVYAPLAANPGRLENLIPPNFSEWIIIDEIQKIPALLNEVHRLIERKKLKFLLTGSSARSLRRQGVNLLAGRALRYYMHPLVIQEFPTEFKLANVLQFGLLPAVIKHPEPRKYLETYVQTYLREEVLQEGLTRSLGSFTRFLEVASFSQGQVLNVAEIARELALNRLTVANYFDILDDLLLSVRLSPFTQRAKRRMIAHQKFYFFDVGVYKTLRPAGPLDTLAEGEGAGLETLFLQSLRAINDYYELGYQIYFWRTQAGEEVDFVLYGPNGLHAFELKRSGTITSKSLKGLQAFGQDYPEAQLSVIYLGKQTEYHGKITARPIIEALLALPQLLGNKPA